MTQIQPAPRNARRASGFTLIELLIVLVIMGILSSIGIGALMKAMQRSRVVSAAEAVVRVHNEARSRALSSKPSISEAGQMFGVAVMPPCNGQSGYAVLLKGSTASDVLKVDVDGDGTPDREVLKVPFGVGVEAIASHQDDGGEPQPLSGPLVWWYGWNGGDPVATPASAMSISVGTSMQAARERVTGSTAYGDWGTNDLLAMATPSVPASPVCSYLAFTQGSIRVALQIYPMGPANWEIDP